jgi:hypothetical protein
VCGPTGVGKSTAGFRVFLRALRAGLTAGYLDVDQLSIVGPRPADHHVRAQQLAAVWHGYRRAGARVAVVTGPLPGEAVRRVYAGALPGATLTVCRLHAGPDELTRRILARGRGGSWCQPGDPLLGRPAGELRRVAERAAREADALDRAGTGDRIDTDGHTVEQVADAIAARAGWLGAPPTGPVS